jgi:hypothetical protein
MFQQRQNETFYEAWTRYKDLLRKVPHHGIEPWLQIQIFYDKVDYQTRRAIDYTAKGRLNRLSIDECWKVLEGLAQYEEEGWEDPMFPSKGKLDYAHATQEQLLGSIEKQVKELMSIEKPAAETMWNPNLRRNAVIDHNFPERSRQEEFEGIMVTFMDNQEKQIQHLEARMESTHKAFMNIADQFISRVKERIKENSVPRKIEKVFEVSTPLAFDQEDSEKFSPSAPPLTTFRSCEHPQKEKNSQFHNIFVGCLRTTVPNICKRRSFGFKPGVKRLYLKNTTDLKPSMEQHLFVHTDDPCEGYNLAKTSPNPSYNLTSFRDSNETFDPGGLH